MDEDEEVDILGTYISKISSGQLLSCDYTVHPNWVNENAEGGNFWTDSVPKHESLESNVRVLQSEEVVIKVPEPVPSIIEFEWNRESNVQEDLIFEDDIPATIEEVVEEEVFNSVSSAPSNSDQCHSYEDQYLDSWELAAFETHPPAKNAKYIGPTNPRSLLKVKIESQTEITANNYKISRNYCKSNNEKPPQKFRQTLTVSPSVLTSGELPKYPIKLKSNKQSPQKTEIGKAKFKHTIKMPSNCFGSEKFKFPKKIKETEVISRNIGKYKRHRKQTNPFGENITINHEMEPKQTEFIVPETVVKLEACDTDSDIEIDIESDASNEESLIKAVHSKPLDTTSSSENPEDNIKLPLRQISPLKEYHKNQISKELEHQLKDLNTPTQELQINIAEISELEKFVHSEFFENRITKTPEQYLRIRNHILSMWRAAKPNYISKTAVRSGLKQAGDVNCISRIHRLLEQLGAINFGHQGNYFNFIRPLECFISSLAQPPRARTNSNPSLPMNSLNIERRQRVRVNSSIYENLTYQDANYTISHMDGIVRPNPPALNSNRNKPHLYTSHIKTELDLVKCLKFSKENIAPFKVSITLSTLLCLHFHSLSSDYEVMGFLGGHRSKSVGRNKLSLTRYKPCRTSQQSGTMCEMCPVSQVEQSSSLQLEGFELLGWFHSHPLFPPNPSRTDVQTQKEMQLQFSFEDRPLIGMILGCLNMSLKCMYIMPKDLHSDFNDNGLPFELDVDVIKDCTDFKNDVKEVLSLVRKNCDSPTEIVEKFKSSSDAILSHYGYQPDTFFEGIFS